MLATHFAIKDHNENILGFDLLNGQTWHSPDGNMWSFSSNDDPSPLKNWDAVVQLFHTAPVLPDTKIPAAAQNEASIVNADLERQSVLTVDYWHLNANTAPLPAVVLNIPNLTATIQEAPRT